MKICLSTCGSFERDNQIINYTSLGPLEYFICEIPAPSPCIAGLLAQGLRVWRSPMATTWPGSCTVFMTWPWHWIYIRAWQDLETGLKRTLTFKHSEIISTWHFRNSNNNSTISNPSSISKIPKLSSLGKSKIYFITSWLGSLLACGTGRRRPSRSSSATFSSKQFLLVWTTLKFARVSVKY